VLGFFLGLWRTTGSDMLGLLIFSPKSWTPHNVTFLSPTRKAIAPGVDSMRVQTPKDKISFSIWGIIGYFFRYVVEGVQMARKLNFYGPGDRPQAPYINKLKLILVVPTKWSRG